MSARFIWKPGSKGRMHYQAHSNSGEALNASLCGIVYGEYRTINPPFSLGKGVCQHCKNIAAGRRSLASVVQEALPNG